MCVCWLWFKCALNCESWWSRNKVHLCVWCMCRSSDVWCCCAQMFGTHCAGVDTVLINSSSSISNPCELTGYVCVSWRFLDQNCLLKWTQIGGVLMWSSCWTYSVNLSSVPGDGDGQSRWCLSQVKGAVDDDVAEGKTHPWLHKKPTTPK